MTIIIPQTSPLYLAFQNLAIEKRMVLFAGIPGVGKSLMLQQFSLMAHEVGRKVHLLQYDVGRILFETDELLARHPEIGGVTHPMIRKGVGVWARTAVADWHAKYDPDHILIGEAPVIGNRLSELAYSQDDEAEQLMSSEAACFVIPAPSQRVRQMIEAAREKSIANPQHEKEPRDAPPNVMRMLWQEIARLGFQVGVMAEEPQGEVAYDVGVYTAVYEHILQHRHTQTLIIDEVLKPQGSVYDLGTIQSELQPTAEQVEKINAELVQKYTPAQLEQLVADWYKT